MERTVNLREGLSAGLIAGAAGGILTDLFLIVAQLAVGSPSGEPANGIAGFFAAALLRDPAMTNPALIALGVLLRFCIAVGWGLGYAYLIRRQPQLLARPWISGTAFGLVVYTFVQIVALGGGYHPPKAAEIEIALLANIVFYGIPVALTVSRLLRNA